MKKNALKLFQCIIKRIKRTKITTDLSVFCLIYQNYFERFMQQQINAHFESILSKFQCGFRKGLETTKEFLLRLSLTDLSKTFKCFRFGKNSVYSFQSGIQFEKRNIHTVQFGMNRQYQMFFYLFGLNKTTVSFILWSYCKAKVNSEQKKNSRTIFLGTV